MSKRLIVSLNKTTCYCHPLIIDDKTDKADVFTHSWLLLISVRLYETEWPGLLKKLYCVHMSVQQNKNWFQILIFFQKWTSSNIVPEHQSDWAPADSSVWESHLKLHQRDQTAELWDGELGTRHQTVSDKHMHKHSLASFKWSEIKVFIWQSCYMNFHDATSLIVQLIFLPK